MLSQQLLNFNKKVGTGCWMKTGNGHLLFINYLKLGIAKFWNLCYYTLRKEINGYYVILY